MKKFKRKMPILFCLCLAIICCALPLTACTDGENPIEKVAGTAGLEYTLSDDGEYYYLSGLGSAKDEEEIVIANYYNDKPVKQIGKYTWMTWEEAKSAMEESDIEYVDLLLFKESEVKRVTVPEGITTIGVGGFHSFVDPNEVYFYPHIIEYISLPNSLTTICLFAFGYCSSLTSITIPNSVTSIGEYAFRDCRSLESITIPNSVTSIGEKAFLYCSSLTDIAIPDSVTYLGAGAFYGCHSHTIRCGVAEQPSGWNSGWNYDNRPVVWNCKNNDIADDGYIYTTINRITYKLKDNIATVARQLPVLSGEVAILDKITHKNTEYSVTTIDDYAFRGCNELTSITIPDSVTYIGEYAFGSCHSLTDITIPNSVTAIGDYAFEVCSSLENITIPNNVISIGDGAFSYCSSFTSITIPDSVTTIGEYAFGSCHSLTDITIPNSVISIGDGAFSYCSSFTSITIPNGVIYIGVGAFDGCHSLTICCEVAEQPSGWVYDWNRDNRPVVWNCKINDIADDGYIYTTINRITYKLKDNITTVARQSPALSGEVTILDKITHKSIEYSVTTIDDYAFMGCNELTSITIPDSVTSIGRRAFSDCDSLAYNEYSNALYLGNNDNPYGVLIKAKNVDITTCNINENTQCIVDFAFDWCDKLTSITIPNNVTYIGAYAFRDCNSLEIVYWNATNCTSVEVTYPIFDHCTGITNIIIGENVKTIPNGAFRGCKSLTSIIIPDNVTAIGEYAFSGCYSLTSITIGNGITSIGSNVFSGCGYLTSIIIPDSVVSIDDDAFKGCPGIKTAIIPALAIPYLPNPLNIVITSGTSIDSRAFINCRNLTSIIIPDSVTYIGGGAFTLCRSLTIYCEATEQPSGWDSDWNRNGYGEYLPVVWGYKPEN